MQGWITLSCITAAKAVVPR